MNIALAQLNYHIGNFAAIEKQIVKNIEKAKSNNVDLIVFSELAVCGYPPHDLLEQKDFVEKSIETIESIAIKADSIGVIIGGISLNLNSKGKNLFNSAYFLFNGKIQKIFNKTLLPTYDIFDEYRYFEPNTEFEILEFQGKKIAITICEDLWDEQPSDVTFSKDKLYKISPLEELVKQNPDFIINISASPYSYNQCEYRRSILVNKAKKYNLPLIYVNQVGAQTELVFDGASLIISSKGEVLSELNSFSEDYKQISTNDFGNYNEISKKPLLTKIEGIRKALVLGISDYFSKMNFTKATLGLSGGIDSAVTLVLAVEALGNKNVRVLLMPSKYSSQHSIDDAVKLAKNLNVSYDVISIEKSVETFSNSLKDIFTGKEEDITEENIQARIRAVLLMALSNKFGHILLNTSNKSEAAVGYGTLYGDMNGGLSVLGDVYKTDVFSLARFINKDKEIIPENTIKKPPSAELRPNQVDQDSLPEYDILDDILYQYIELKKSASEIISEKLNADLVNKVIHMVNVNEYKRFQTSPIIRVSSKAFGFGRRMPLVAKY